ncbi:MAG TPA: peptidase, partial [Pedobacter sp.]
MKKIILSFLFIGLLTEAWSQNTTAIKYAELLTPENARKHLNILASDEFEGRETGKKGAELAANYIANEFKKLNLKAPVSGSYFQNVQLVEGSFVVDKFQVNNKQLQNLRDFYLSSASVSRKVKAEEIIFAGYGISTEGY